MSIHLDYQLARMVAFLDSKKVRGSKFKVQESQGERVKQDVA
jgi:hypothetical protein